MKHLLTLTLFLLVSATNLFAQESMKVTMRITYKGAPLCFWDVTIKHGDMVLDQGKTDENGFVDFGYVKLLSYGIDASGYKKTANGEKNWDVKGYITVNENGHADFDFQPLVEEMGMGGMLESAWGLTLNDCGSGSSSASSGTTTSSDSSTNTTSSNSTTTDNGTETTSGKSTLEQWDEESAKKEEERKAEQEQWQQDWESGKTTAEGYQNQRTMYINKIDDLNRKIAKKTEERNAVKQNSKEYSELSYEIKDMELERSITQLKLERIEKEIANNNTMLGKTERDYYNQQEDALKAEQKALKEKRDSGKGFSETTSNSGSTETTSNSGSAETVSESENDAEEKYTVYTVEEFAGMSTLNLQKLKLEYQTKVGKRKTVLKTQNALLNAEKKAKIESEILELENMITQIEAELTKRKDQ